MSTGPALLDPNILDRSPALRPFLHNPATSSRLGPLEHSVMTTAVNNQTLTVNQQVHEVDAAPDTPLLWVLRDHLGMTGTKFACGKALCGACTVHVDGMPIRSCSVPLSAVLGKSITTIEGLSANRSHPVQKAWIEIDVPQCGYCQSGQIMSAVALLGSKPDPTDADIDAAMAGNLCRCGTYSRIRTAIHRAAEIMKSGS
jgi:aerobic-type carbon monoxide dehydrogenase small subunit (CoxS/CutS family)